MSSAVGQRPVANSTLLNGSSDDLWTDTDDESFVRATQSVLDANCFTSPLAVARSTAITSTPNMKSTRCRRAFSLDPVPTVPRPMNMHPRASATVCLSLPVASSSPMRDASFNEELLATLAEPDDVLDSQMKQTDAGVSSESLNLLQFLVLTARYVTVVVLLRFSKSGKRTVSDVFVKKSADSDSV